MTHATRHAPAARSTVSRLGRAGAEILACLRLGLRLLASELRWSLFRSLRRMEIRRITVRLDQELRRLGESVADSGQTAGRTSDQTPDDEAELTLRQINFLRREAAWLEGELVSARRRFLDDRRRSLSL